MTATETMIAVTVQRGSNDDGDSRKPFCNGLRTGKSAHNLMSQAECSASGLIDNRSQQLRHLLQKSGSEHCAGCSERTTGASVHGVQNHSGL